MNESKIEAVIFDVGNVLTDFHPGDYFESLGYPKDMADRLRRATMETPEWKEYDRGVLTDEEVRARFKKYDPEIAEEIDKSLTHMTGLVTRREAAIPWIESVKARGIRTYVLSNFSFTCLEDCREALDFEFHLDGALWSCVDKVIKPDLSAFLLCLHKFGIDPHRAVFIDDREDNLVAARKTGLRTILYRNQQQAEEDLKQLLDEE